MSLTKRWLDSMIEEVEQLTEQGWEQAEAIRSVAAKHDVVDWQLAYYILGENVDELLV